MRGSRGGTGVRPPPPPKNHKNIELSNTRPDPRVCATWRTSTQCPCIFSLFFFLNQIRALWNHVGWCLLQMWSAKAQGSLRFCTISSGSRCPLKVLKVIKAKAEKSRHRFTCYAFKYANINFIRVLRFSKSTKRAPTKRLNTMDHHTYAQTHKPRCK